MAELKEILFRAYKREVRLAAKRAMDPDVTEYKKRAAAANALARVLEQAGLEDEYMEWRKAKMTRAERDRLAAAMEI